MSYYCFDFSANEQGEHVIHKNFTCKNLPKKFNRVGLGYCDTIEEALTKAAERTDNFTYVLCEHCDEK